MSPTFEMQVSEEGGAFFVTMTICTQGSQWTSPAARLDAGNWDDATAEARSKVAATRKSLLLLS